MLSKRLNQIGSWRECQENVFIWHPHRWHLRTTQCKCCCTLFDSSRRKPGKKTRQLIIVTPCAIMHTIDTLAIQLRKNVRSIFCFHCLYVFIWTKTGAQLGFCEVPWVPWAKISLSVLKNRTQIWLPPLMGFLSFLSFFQIVILTAFEKSFHFPREHANCPYGPALKRLIILISTTHIEFFFPNCVHHVFSAFTCNFN